MDMKLWLKHVTIVQRNFSKNKTQTLDGPTKSNGEIANETMALGESARTLILGINAKPNTRHCLLNSSMHMYRIFIYSFFCSHMWIHFAYRHHNLRPFTELIRFILSMYFISFAHPVFIASILFHPLELSPRDDATISSQVKSTSKL